jgi:hypothetical protein
MTAVILCAKAGLAVLLLVAGGAKLADLAGFGAAVRLFLPARAIRLASPAGLAIAAAELVAGGVSLCWPALGWVNIAVLVLAVGFAVVAVTGYIRHRGQQCRCFGTLSQRGFGRREVGQAMAIMAAAVIAARPAGGAQLQLATTAQVLLLCGAGLTAVAARTAAGALAPGAGAAPAGTLARQPGAGTLARQPGPAAVPPGPGAVPLAITDARAAG